MQKRRNAGKKGTKMAAQWDEEQKLEEILVQREMEGSPGQFEVVRRVPELVVHERMSQGVRVKGLKEKNVLGWSLKELKEELSVAEKEDAEEVRKSERSEPE